MQSCVLAVVIGLALLLCGSGAVADALQECKDAIAKREIDLAVTACDRAAQSASIPTDLIEAGRLRSLAYSRRDLAAHVPPIPDKAIVIDPDEGIAAVIGPKTYETDPLILIDPDQPSASIESGI
jgi:hypothetical protein